MNADGQHAPRSPVVLVVDDEPLIREFLAVALADAGFTVCAAEDGVAALAALRSIRPVAVVTDLMMPRMDGWELCRRLRGAAETATIPLIVVSALQTKAAPGDAFLAKPFELDALLAVLRRLAPLSVASADGTVGQTGDLTLQSITDPQPW